MAVRDKELYKERDEALYKAYKEARKKLLNDPRHTSDCGTSIHAEAIKMAIDTPQPRFWITQDRTYRIILSLIKNNGNVRTWRTKKKMHDELMATFQRITKLRMFKGMPVFFVASFITFEPASGFFMNFYRATRIIKAQRLAHLKGNSAS